jgi:2-keto-3-deoxy-L-rhamnonate aldolase RhmA
LADIANPARTRLAAGELALGCGIRLARTVDIARIMKACGYDWLFIDMEHGTLDLDTSVQMAVAALEVGIAPIARVPKMEHSLASRFLDGGGLGIVMPHVDTADEARVVVDRQKFPPDGHRSAIGPLAQFGFAARRGAEANAALNAASMVIVMVESPTAVGNAEAIAAVPGVDCLLIGTNDLSTEMGIPGEVGHARVTEAYKTVGAACQKHGKVLGMGGVYDPPLMQRYIDLGARMILSGNDMTLMMAAARNQASALREFKLG